MIYEGEVIIRILIGQPLHEMGIEQIKEDIDMQNI